MTNPIVALAALLVSILVSPAAARAQQTTIAPASCERLASLTFPNTTITRAEVVAAGAFTPPAAGGQQGGGLSPALGPGRAAGAGPAAPPNAQGGQGGAAGGIPDVPGRVTLATAGLGLGYNGDRPNAQYRELPAFCRVTATLTPSATSDIRAEVWLPLSGWNGSFRGTSPNGTGGNPNYTAIANALRDGFAAVSMDTGHRAGDATWMRDPEKLRDFGGRAIHETTVLGKALTATLYGSGPKFSYMLECGGGSTAALAEVQRYPADYDGVVVGGFAAYWTRQVFGQAWAWQAANQSATSFVPPEKFPMIHDAVLKACDARDQVRDGLIENPTRCAWDPKAIQCTGADQASCLTAAQVETVRKLYAGPTNPRTGEKIHSPIYRGSELDWAWLIAGEAPIANAVMRDFVLADPAWNIRTRPVDFDGDVARADRPELAVMNQVNPEISPYVARGGKLILAGGWANAIVPPGAIVDYYQKVRSDARTESGTERRTPVHGAWNERVQRRSWHGHLRPARGDTPMGGAGPSAQRDRGIAGRAWQGGADPSALPLSASGDLPWHREHGRGRKLRLSGGRSMTRLRARRLLLVGE
ncbi:MAG: tannase/feruloyl esterase family alpha/beta hydrolase [Vicinamibacterales bacterium]